MEFIPAKTIVTKTKSTAWFGCDYNMNIYRGCNHGCIYCDSRSECYRIPEFDKVCAKEDALRIIRDDLRRKIRKGVIGTGSMSDPYNPFEKTLNLTRNALELVNAFGFGISIATKSNLITRDIDVLKDIKKHSPIIVKLTITAASDEMSKKIEPLAPPSSERFKAIRELSDAGIYCGILMMPILPFITDQNENIREILNLAKENGARFVYPAFGVTLRGNQRDYYYQKLDELFPGLKEKYIKNYGERYSCGSQRSKELLKVFVSDSDRLGLIYNMKDIIRSYKLGYEDNQLSFL